LDEGTTYQFRARTYTTKTTTPDGGSESRTNYSSWTSTVNVTTIGWNEIVLEGVTGQMSVASGIGYDTPEAALHSDEDRVTKYYLDTTILGTHEVDVMRAIDSAQAWDGNGYWYGVGAFGDRSAVAFVRNNTGDILPSQYHLAAHTPPLDPTGMEIDNVTSTSMTLNWTCPSTIESGFKIYHRTGSAATKDNASLLDTLPTDTIDYTATGLSSGTEHYFAVYAYRGNGFSGVLQGNEGTLAAPVIDYFDATGHPTVQGRVVITWNTSNVTNVTLLRNTNGNTVGFTLYPNDIIVNNSTSVDSSYDDDGLGDDVTRYYQLTATGAGGTVYSSVDSGTTIASPDPSWGSQPSIGTVSTIEEGISYLPTTNPSSFTISLTDPDTDANQVTGTISNKQTAVGDGTWTTITCLVSTSTISNSATGWGTSDTTTAYGSSDTIHFRFRIRSSRSAPQGTAAGTFDFTLSNGGVDSTFTGISWDVGEFIP